MLTSPHWAAGGASAAYKAVFPTFNRVAASRTVRPNSSSARARRSFSSFIDGLRPPLRPRLAAAAIPALVRSRIRSRSNWPRAPKTWKISRPPGVVVSIASVSDRRPTPRASRAVTVSMRWVSDRPRRSSFQTTRTSSSRTYAIAAARPGLFAFAPEARSS